MSPFLTTSTQLLEPRAIPSSSPYDVHRDLPTTDTPRYDEPVPSFITAGTPPVGIAVAPQFSSLPGAALTIYLDFDGHVTEGTDWNTYYNNPSIVSPAYDVDGDATTFSAFELAEIEEIWNRVAEDFIPFNVNVTTIDPGVEALRRTNANDLQYGIRAVLTQDTLNDGAGGRAYVDSFSSATDTPAWVWNHGARVAADTVSHEVGHSLGLSHDGYTPTGAEYYGGHGTGDTSWAPIMGAYFTDGTDNNLTTWDNGVYSGHSNTGSGANYGNGAGDLEVITRAYHGVTYRNDDFGNTIGAAAVLSTTVDGIIERNNDVDYFSINHAGGVLNLEATPFSIGPNLDIQLRLFDSNSSLIGTYNPEDLVSASILVELAAGTYYVEVDGIGFGSPLTSPPTGYNDYGSIGRYTLAIGAAPPEFYQIVDQDFLNIDLISSDAGVSEVLTSADDGTALISFGGNQFNFGGTVFSDLYVSSNGTISFYNNFSEYSNVDITQSEPSPYFILPFWDDLVTNINSSDSVLYSFANVIGDSEPELIVEWNIHHFGGADLGTFQVILSLNTDTNPGDIIFNYVDTNLGSATYDYGASATVGIMNLDYENGVIQYSFDTPNAVMSGTAIRFTTNLIPDDEDDQISEAPILDGSQFYTLDFPSDVDMYSVTAFAGQHLTFALNFPGTIGDSYLRLFNSAGVELAFDDDSGFESASLLSYTFTQSGTYYLGVSAFPNTSYDAVTGEGDVDGNSLFDTYTITTNVYYPPTNISLSGTSLAENRPVGTAVGSFSTTDLDFSDSHNYTLVSGSGSTDNAAFTIVGNQLRSNVSFDYETKPSYSIRVRTTDSNGLFFEKVFTISVVNLYEPVRVIDFAQAGYQEPTGTWATSGSVLGVGGSSTRFSNTAAASVRWNTDPLEPGWYQVEMWNVAHSTNTTSATLTVKHGTQTTTSTFNHVTSPAGWRSIGTFYFDGTSGNFVQLSKSGTGYLRADAVCYTSIAVTVNNEDGAPQYQEPTGTWSTSGAIGGSQGTSTRYSNNTTTSVRWNAPTLTAGWYQVEFWNVAHSSNITSATITVLHNGTTVTSTFNHATAPAGWRNVGTFYFDGTSSQYLQLSKSGAGYLRADAARFTPVVQPILTVNNEDGAPRYQEQAGTWSTSTALTGFNGTSTRFSNSTNATVRWNTTNLSPGWYQVEFYNVAHSTNTTAATLTIQHSSQTTRTFNQVTTSSGWKTLGKFYFNGTTSNFVQLSKSGSGYLRADAVRFTAAVAPTLLVNNENTQNFTTPSGSWQSSGLAGSHGGSVYSSSVGAEARFQFANLLAGLYQIQIFVPAATNSTSQARYAINSNSTTSSVTIDQRPGGWITLGDFNLGSSAMISLTNLSTGLLRADVIRLVPKISFT